MISPQRKWQLAKIAEGICPACGKAKSVPGKKHCKKCAKRLRIAARNRYRLKHGIPLDTPLHERRSDEA